MILKKVISLAALILVLACIIISTRKDPISTIPAPVVNKDRYTNEEFKFSFPIPKGWYVNDPNPSPSYVQLLNYDLAKAEPKSIFPPGYNKIEISVRELSEVAAIKENDEEVLQYEYEVRNVSLADRKNILRIVMYGDKNNFYLLDEFVRTIKTN